MHYRTSAVEGMRDTLDPLDKFCREMGVDMLNTQPKLVVTRNNLPAEMQVVILSNRG
jgi:hypothetical protein